MLKNYKVGRMTCQYEEGEQPADAIELDEHFKAIVKPLNKAITETENKSVTAPEVKSLDGTEK